MKIYTDINVYDAAIQRLKYIYSEFDNVAVCISGGKDSTATMELAIVVARELGRLPIDVVFIDQEAEYQATVDYVASLLERPNEIKLHWYQVPLKLFFAGALAGGDEWLISWDEKEKEKWMHPQVECSIKENTFGKDRFKEVFDFIINDLYDGEPSVNMNGMRADESYIRYLAMQKRTGGYKGNPWFSVNLANRDSYKCYPLYDWKYEDVWFAINKFGWKYSGIYDAMMRLGTPKKNMRVSSLIHEMSIRAIKDLQALEPNTYDKLVARLGGAHTYKMIFGAYEAVLPDNFGSWKDYRDYLLEHFTNEENAKRYLELWKAQNGDEEYYREHVREILKNDYEGNLNTHYITRRRKEDALKEKYGKRTSTKMA